jgi:hypothetical protein
LLMIEAMPRPFSTASVPFWFHSVIGFDCASSETYWWAEVFLHVNYC